MDIIFAFMGYLLGSIPFGLVLTRAAGLGDIRSIGSGNIGATNVLRTGNKKLAIATLVLDGAKGAVAVGLAALLSATETLPYCAVIECATPGACPCLPGSPSTDIALPMLLAGLGAICGHIFPIWLKFKGGKGVATTLGTLLALAPFVGLAACGTWLVTAALFRFSSLSALVALALTPVYSLLFYHDVRLALVCALVAALVFYTHRANIQRLLKGEEPKIGKKNKT